MEILDVLTDVAKTGRLGPVFSGADWSDVTATLGEPWGVGTMSRNRKGEEPVLNVMSLPGNGHDLRKDRRSRSLT
ncbi:hypothetical protein ACFXPY_15825 [Streptomyces sp. NPDC059153]|uniref:hypothetical protein n=1 Tax=unclassified Streptomyces TaxID=2593676 RepID=UPI00369DD5D0